jgi:hypothetical protein
VEVIEALVQFGVAGLMGALWVWERTYSRQREQQLSEVHGRLTRREESVGALVRLVRQNTRAMVRVERTQNRMCEVLEGIQREMSSERKGV